jgi:methyl halide transferase
MRCFALRRTEWVRLAGFVLVLLLLGGGSWPTARAAEPETRHWPVDLERAHAAAAKLGGPAGVDGSLDAMRDAFFVGVFPEKDGRVVAFEEHPRFVYAVGTGGRQSVRRVLLWKPTRLWVEDRTAAAPPGEQAAQPARDESLHHHVRLLDLSDAGAESLKTRWAVHEDRTEVSFERGSEMLRLTLPGLNAAGSLADLLAAPGWIEIVGDDGKAIIERRPLPGGVLPHGPEGMKLLERWDSAYRGGRRPGWDVGRPSSDLRQAVEEGTLKPARALELGCGTGTNAIYLAGKEFDVTAVDIAPTALRLAAEKAEKAELKKPPRWLLADVLNLPEMEPFDVIYDRGCYHGVRRQNAAGYVETLRRMTRPGSRVLILAGSAAERSGGGPPRVEEAEIRADFSELFEFEWLRATRFDTPGEDRAGAMAWAILLKRK